MFQKLFRSDDSTVSLVLRLTVAAVMLPHGLQKLVGAFGGYGFEGTMGFFTQQMGIPAPLAFLVIVAESFGAAALVLGLLTRPAALGLLAVMIGAIFMQHAQHGLFMNWSGAQKGEGFEFHLLVVAMTGVLTVVGAGRWSLDRIIAARLAARAPASASSRALHAAR